MSGEDKKLKYSVVFLALVVLVLWLVVPAFLGAGHY